MAQFFWPPVSISSSPIQYNLNAVATTVSENTANEALSTPLPVKIISNVSGAGLVDYVYYDYASGQVTSAAWVQIKASTAAASTKITVFDGGGQPMYLGVGAPGVEVVYLVIPQGGLNGQITLSIPAGSRLSLKAAATTNTTGNFVLNLFG